MDASPTTKYVPGFLRVPLRGVRQSIHKIRFQWWFIRKRRHFRKVFRSVPLGAAFGEIYRTKAWGSVADEKFYSGAGSTPEFANQYAEWVNQFVAENGIRHIVDLGCGDFRVGRLLKLSPAVRYTGIDVVPELIQFNQEHFRTASVDFRTANIIEDPLPNGDLCLIRQVLQHMSNQQIAKVIASCSRYRYVLITEDLYAGPDLRPNLENPGGWDTRTYENSGVFLDLPPFNLPLRTVLEISGVGAVPTILRTALLERSKPLPSEP